jgi:hypothetical protein
LLDEGLITDEQLAAARNAQINREKSIGRALVDMSILTEEAKMVFLKKKLGFEIVDIGDMQIAPHIITRLPRSYAEKHCCVPILIEEGKLVLAMEDPTDLVVIDEIQNQTGLQVPPVLATISDIHRVTLQYPQLSQKSADRVVRRSRSPFWDKYLRPLVLIIIVIAPLFLFWASVRFIDQVGNFFLRMADPFSIALYLTLGFALWSIIIWEIDGLIFGHTEPSE